MRALLTAAFLLSTLLLGAHRASAAPPTPLDPPEILTPIDPPDPRPCEVHPVPCTPPTLVTDFPTEEPAPAPTTTTTDAAQPAQPDTAGGRTPTDTALDTSAGTTAPGTGTSPVATSWWLIAVPLLALLGLTAAGAVALVRRSERRPS